jgi:hypothetical protein
MQNTRGQIERSVPPQVNAALLPEMTAFAITRLLLYRSNNTACSLKIS